LDYEKFVIEGPASPAALSNGDESENSTPSPTPATTRSQALLPSSFQVQGIEVSDNLRKKIARLILALNEIGNVGRFEVLTGDALKLIPSLEVACQGGKAFDKIFPNAHRIHAQCVCSRKAPLDEDQCTAIRMYTANGLYQNLNNVLRLIESRGDERYEALVPYMHYMLSGLAKLSSSRPITVYRGLDATFIKAHGSKYQKDRVVSYRAFTSCSKNESVSRGFAGPGGCLLRITLRTVGSCVAAYSVVPNEDEILIPPRVPLRVVRIVESGPYREVHLEEL
jgi:hypothetical protein